MFPSACGVTAPNPFASKPVRSTMLFVCTSPPLALAAASSHIWLAQALFALDAAMCTCKLQQPRHLSLAL